MKSNTRRLYIEDLIHSARTKIKMSEFEIAWEWLAEAHIISQPDPYLHTWVHLEMLKAGIQQKNASEIWGQILRLILAAPGSLSGRYPLGNSGRSHISMFEPMPISPELKEKINKLSSSPH